MIHLFILFFIVLIRVIINLQIWNSICVVSFYQERIRIECEKEIDDMELMLPSIMTTCKSDRRRPSRGFYIKNSPWQMFYMNSAVLRGKHILAFFVAMFMTDPDWEITMNIVEYLHINNKYKQDINNKCDIICTVVMKCSKVPCIVLIASPSEKLKKEFN